MTYKAWRTVYLARVATDARRRARVWNLEHDERFADVAEFTQGIVRRWVDNGGAEDGSVEAALDASIDETRAASSRWLGLLRIEARTGARIPRRTYTHLSGEYVARYGSRGQIDLTRPLPQSVELLPLKWQRSAGPLVLRSRFLWVTWPEPDRPLPRDPTRVKQEFGLAHFAEGDVVYRVRVDVNASTEASFVPTCLDAGLYEAWAPPPAGHTPPWGMTRDLVNGDAAWPELLVESAPRRATSPRGYRVGGRQTIARIGSVAVDFMAGRTMTP